MQKEQDIIVKAAFHNNLKMMFVKLILLLVFATKSIFRYSVDIFLFNKRARTLRHNSHNASFDLY